VLRTGKPRVRYRGSYGTSNDSAATTEYLAKNGFDYRSVNADEIAAMIADNKVVGYISGRYEFGPRALGFRSLLADPRCPENWPRVNDTIKFREDFRPFAPVMLPEEAERYWGKDSLPTKSPYMLLAPRMNDRAKDELGAVIHRDMTARVQTLEPEFNRELHDVLCAFKRLTGIGVLLNTSLNMSGESIIVDHLDLLRLMAFSDIDAVVLDDVVVTRAGNEKCLKTMVYDLPDRKSYLRHRRMAYETRGYNARKGVLDFDFTGFYRLLYGEDPN
jgi:predicted NodU family carbamoyl transferase